MTLRAQWRRWRGWIIPPLYVVGAILAQVAGATYLETLAGVIIVLAVQVGIGWGWRRRVG